MSDATFKLVDQESGNETTFESRSGAEQAQDDMRSMGVDVVLEPVNNGTPDTVDGDLNELGQDLETDPLDILPSHMIDSIQGTPAVNRRGYAMIAEHAGIEVMADIHSFPWENEENRAVAHATAVTEDDRTYSGWATASEDEDSDMQDSIIELAETRAMKRAIAWASGVGIVGARELMGGEES